MPCGSVGDAVGDPVGGSISAAVGGSVGGSSARAPGSRKFPTTRVNQSKHHQSIISRSFNEDYYEMAWPGGMREAFK